MGNVFVSRVSLFLSKCYPGAAGPPRTGTLTACRAVTSCCSSSCSGVPHTRPPPAVGEKSCTEQACAVRARGPPPCGPGSVFYFHTRHLSVLSVPNVDLPLFLKGHYVVGNNFSWLHGKMEMWLNHYRHRIRVKDVNRLRKGKPAWTCTWDE